jgi:hypothetical protein
MGTIHRARAVMKIKGSNTVSVTGRANSMCSGIAAHPALFVTPDVPVTTIQAQIVVVNNAEIVAATRAKGAAAARNVQRTLLVGLLEKTLTYVQGIADNCPSQEQAVAAIQAAGCVVAGVGGQVKPILAAKQGPEAGAVILAANARALTGGSQRKHFFNWSYSGDGGKTWVGMPSTAKAKTTLDGLTPLTTYEFRVSVTTSDTTTGPWSQTFAFLVH